MDRDMLDKPGNLLFAPLVLGALNLPNRVVMAPMTRCRATEVAAAVAAGIGAERTGIRISPGNPYNDIHDVQPRATFTTLAGLLRPIGLAWMHLVEPVPEAPSMAEPRLAPELRAAFGGPVILAGRQSRETAEQALARGEADAIAFGRPFIANPDLPARLCVDAPLAEPDPRTIYQGGADGHVGLPAWEAEKAA
jgi:N-ethylmaleimide reductase